MDATTALLGGAIDYAGLFPPAQLGMREAAGNYAAYRRGDDAWALGRFVVPANRIDELVAAHGELPDASPGDVWPLSVLAGPHLTDDLSHLSALDARGLRIASLEIRASAPDEISAIGDQVRNEYETYIEIPLGDGIPVLVQQIGEAGLRAKIRTGGVIPDAFPAPDEVARFVSACLAARVPFKATAGLHHLRTGSYRLTYDADSAAAPMFGYLNVLAATALLREGAGERDAEHVLRETDPSALRIEDDALVWRDRRVDAGALAALRREGFTSFGSCSFREPLDELAGARAA